MSHITDITLRILIVDEERQCMDQRANDIIMKVCTSLESSDVINAMFETREEYKPMLPLHPPFVGV